MTTIPLTAEWDRTELTEDLVEHFVVFVTFVDVASSGRFRCEYYPTNGPHIIV